MRTDSFHCWPARAAATLSHLGETLRCIISFSQSLAIGKMVDSETFPVNRKQNRERNGSALTLRFVRGLRVAACLCLVSGIPVGYVAVRVAQAQETTAGVWAMRAATVTPGGVAPAANAPAEVRLIWIPTKGWLPAGGFNLYRAEGGNALVRLNTAPLKEQLISDTIKTRLRSAPAGIAALEIAAPAHERLSSGATFGQIAQEAQTLHQTGGLGATAIRNRLSQSAALQTHRRLLRPAPQKQTVVPPLPGTLAASAAPAPPTEAENVAAMRSQVLLHAISDRSVALQMGLAYDDKAVRGGVKYRYVLRGVDASGAEDPKNLVELAFTAGADGPPPAPVVSGFQYDQTIADLHWEPLDAATSKNLLHATYNVFRDTAKINNGPVLIAYQETADGKSIPSPTTFRDSHAPLGNVTYKVVLVDAFGRESLPGAFTVAMKDERMPVPPRAARAVLGSDKKSAEVYWVAAINDDNVPAMRFNPGQTPVIAYDITRKDTENTSAVPARVTEASVAGASVTTAALPAEVLLDLMGDGAVRSLLTEGTNIKGGKSGTLADGIAFRQLLAGKTVAQVSEKSSASAKTALAEMVGQIRHYADPNAPADHFVRYGVSAHYSINSNHTAPTETAVLPVPLLTPLSTPSAPTLTFARTPGVLFGSYDTATGKAQHPTANPPRMTAPAPLPMSKTNTTGYKVGMNGSKGTATTPTKPLGRGAQLGGTVTISWQPVTPNTHVRYRVYRVGATGLFPTALNASRLGGIATGTLPHGTYHSRGGAQGLAMKYFADYPNAANLPFALLGETEDTSWADDTPRSHAVNYLYKVQAVSRWGVESAVSPVAKIHVKATLPPSVPMLLTAQATDDGYVALTARPNIVEEQVASYHVFRKELQADVQVVQQTPRPQPSAQVASNGHGAARPAAPPVTAPRSTLTATFNGKPLTGQSPQARQRGSSGLRFGVKRFTSPATLVNRGVGVRNGMVKAPQMTPAEIARLVDILTTTELHPGPDADITVTANQVRIVDKTAKPGVTYLYQMIAVDGDGVGVAPVRPPRWSRDQGSRQPPRQLCRNRERGNKRGQPDLDRCRDGGAGSYLLERALKPADAQTASVAGLLANAPVLQGNQAQKPTVIQQGPWHGQQQRRTRHSPHPGIGRGGYARRVADRCHPCRVADRRYRPQLLRARCLRQRSGATGHPLP